MSNASEEEREWRLYVQDMVAFSEKALAYTAGLDQQAFLADERTYDATLRNLSLIGEAAMRVPDYVREAHPEIPWRAIIGARVRLVHVYLGIDDDVVWTIIKDAIPATLPQLRALLAEAE